MVSCQSDSNARPFDPVQFGFGGLLTFRELEQEGVNATLARQVGTERGHSKCQHNYNDRSICCFVRETIQLFVTSNLEAETQIKINRLPKGGGSVT